MSHVPGFLKRQPDPTKPERKRQHSLHPGQQDGDSIPDSPAVSLGARYGSKVVGSGTRPRGLSDGPVPSSRYENQDYAGSSKRSYADPSDIAQQRQPLPRSTSGRGPATSPMAISSATVDSAKDYADESMSEHTFRIGGGGSGSGHRVYMGSSPEDGTGSIDGSTSPKSRSPPGSPGSPRNRHGTAEDGSRRTGNGSRGGSHRDGSPDSDRRRRTKSHRDKMSPLAKRLGEEPPFMLNHPSRDAETSQQYPGVVLGSFAGGGTSSAIGFGEYSVGFDGSMDDILDFSAPRQDGRHDSATGLAPNIAPWLAEDPTGKQDEKSATTTPAYGGIAHKPGLTHYPSHPSLPRIKSSGTEQSLADIGGSTSSSRSGSYPDIFPVPTPEQHHSATASLQDAHRSRHGSTDSVQTLSAGQQAVQQKKSIPPQGEFIVPGGSRGSVAGARLRVGSTFSNVSTGSNDSIRNETGRKKGFLGGLLSKRKQTGTPMNRESLYMPLSLYVLLLTPACSRLRSLRRIASGFWIRISQFQDVYRSFHWLSIPQAISTRLLSDFANESTIPATILFLRRDGFTNRRTRRNGFP